MYPEDTIRDHFFGHLTDVVMVDAKMLAAERLGGADYDGDLVRTIADPILNASVRRNYFCNKYHPDIDLTNNANLPFLMIPTMASPKQNPRDWYARFVTVKNTFSARIGQICNAALDRSVIAYNENTDPKLRKQFKEETEVLAILSGLEIDAAKTGIRPDLSDYLGKKIPRTPFLKYKTMVEAAEERREWYEDTHQQKLDKFFAETDWEKVDSPVERLPLLARQLRKGTRKPKRKKATDEEFSDLVDAQGNGWYIRHIRSVATYAQQNPKLVKAGIRKFFQENLAEYEKRWRIKVRQFQIPIFLEHTDAMWQIRFDDVIANALTLGPLREMEAERTEQQKEKLLPFVQGEVKLKYLTTLVAYYLANKPEDSDWVVLPSTNFNCYFGSTVFSKKVLREITGKVIQRSDTSYGSGRYRVLEEFL